MDNKIEINNKLITISVGKYNILELLDVLNKNSELTFEYLQNKNRIICKSKDNSKISLKFIENDKINIFDKDINEKNTIIENNFKSIEIKKAAIQKLNEEISNLQLESEKTKNRITIKTILYSTLSQQLIAKIKNDIISITNYIQ